MDVLAGVAWEGRSHRFWFVRLDWSLSPHCSILF
jgi:hypothetical protein